MPGIAQWTPGLQMTRVSRCSLYLVSPLSHVSQDQVPLCHHDQPVPSLQYTTPFLFLHLIVERPLGCFKVGPFVDKAAMDVLLGAF